MINKSKTKIGLMSENLVCDILQYLTYDDLSVLLQEDNLNKRIRQVIEKGFLSMYDKILMSEDEKIHIGINTMTNHNQKMIKKRKLLIENKFYSFSFKFNKLSFGLLKYNIIPMIESNYKNVLSGEIITRYASIVMKYIENTISNNHLHNIKLDIKSIKTSVVDYLVDLISSDNINLPYEIDLSGLTIDDCGVYFLTSLIKKYLISYLDLSNCKIVSNSLQLVNIVESLAFIDDFFTLDLSCIQNIEASVYYKIKYLLADNLKLKVITDMEVTSSKAKKNKSKLTPFFKEDKIKFNK